MFVVDLNQILFANFFAAVGKHTNAEINTKQFKHMALNSLRKINKQFRREWGDMVIACDSLTNWRKDTFPEYKANRKKERLATDVDWPTIYKAMDELKADLRDYFPYKVIHVENCEADDVIGVIARRHYGGKILIISGDKDFRQLQEWEGIEQYDPIKKEFLVEDDPELFLHNHVMSGDRSDGIPNVLSDDDALIDENKRQKNLTKKARQQFDHPQHIKDAKYDRNYWRNKYLIDLHYTPIELKNKIWEEFQKEPTVTDNSLLMPYLMKNKLRNLMEFINDF